MENSMEIAQKIQIDLLYDSEIPLLGIYLKESESAYNKGT
jgi:hypothetical protein